MTESEIKNLNDYEWFVLNILVYETNRNYQSVPLEEVEKASRHESYQHRWDMVKQSGNLKVEREMNKLKGFI